jgi:hypothetical protein
MLRGLLAASAVVALAWGGDVRGQGPGPSFTFRVTRRAAGEAQEPRQAARPGGKAVLKVQPGKAVRLFDAASCEPLGPTIPLGRAGYGFRITALAVAPDDRTIATAVGNFSNDWGRVVVWDAMTGERLAERGGLGEVFSLDFGRDGKVVSITSGPAGGK